MMFRPVFYSVFADTRFPLDQGCIAIEPQQYGNLNTTHELYRNRYRTKTNPPFMLLQKIAQKCVI